MSLTCFGDSDSATSRDYRRQICFVPAFGKSICSCGEPRGRGYGLSIWNAAIAHAGPRVIGLDGVVVQRQNYRMSGFELAYANVRYGGTVATPDAPQAGTIALTEVPLATVEAYDATVFPTPRTAFLRAWIGSSGHVGRALVRDGGLPAGA